MYDIVPASSPDASSAKKKRNASSDRQKVVIAGPRVVQLEWKLPSRLRKPIRDQLARERAQRKRRVAAAVTFARKPIRTQALLETDPESTRPGARVQKPRRFFNRGVEHHTTDVYTQGKPQLRVTAPPYLGRVARTAATGEARSVRQQSRQVSAAPTVRRKRVPRVRPKAPAPQAQAVPMLDRDIPMQWGNQQSPSYDQPTTSDDLFANVEKPKRFLPGITLSLWPGHWFGKQQRAERAPATKKKRLIS